MNVAIVGLGLIGGSIAKALKKYTPEHSVWAIESDEATASKALAEGAIDKTVSASQLRFADLTVVALHPEATVEFLESNSGAFAAGNTVIDVCGVKKEIVSRVSRLFGKGVVAFIEQRLQQRMFRMVRLQHHFALFTRTPGTTGDLGVKLGETFCRAKIGRKQRAVHIQ